MAQACHACLERPQQSTHIVVCGVDGLEALQRTQWLLEQHDIEYSIFFEPDDAMGYTAIATEPTINKKIFKKYKLWYNKRG